MYNEKYKEIQENNEKKKGIVERYIGDKTEEDIRKPISEGTFMVTIPKEILTLITDDTISFERDYSTEKIGKKDL